MHGAWMLKIPLDAGKEDDEIINAWVVSRFVIAAAERDEASLLRYW